MDVFDLSAKITLDTKDYDNSLNNAEKSGKGFASKLGGGLKTAAKVSGAAIGAVSAVTGVMTKKFVDGVKATSEYGDKVDKMSQKIGISAKSYQQWDYVMQRAGMSIDTMKMGMKTLSTQAEKNSDSFQKLGISQEEVKNLSQEDLFEKTIEGLSKMEAGTERTKLATELLGRAGADMGPLLNEGTKEIKKQMKMAEDYGMVMSDKAVKASAEFQDSLTTMKLTMGGLKNRMMSGFLPAVTKVTDGLAKMFTGDMSGLDNITNGIDKIVGKISDMMPKIIEVGGKIMEALGNAILENAPKLVPVAVNMIMDFVKYVMDALPKLMEIGVQIISELIKAIANAIPKLTDSAADIVLSLANALIENLPAIIKAGLDLIVGLAKGLLQAIPKIVQEIPKLISSLINAILGAIPQIIQAGIDLLTSLVANLPEIINTIVEAIPEIIMGIVDALVNNVDKIVEAGVNLLSALIENTPKIIANIIKNIPKIIVGIATAIVNGVGKIASAGWKLLKGIFKKLPKFITEIPGKIWKVIKSIASAIGKFASKVWEAGKNLFKKFWEGLKSVWNSIVDWVKGCVEWLKNALAIDAVSSSITKKIEGQLKKQGYQKNSSGKWDTPSGPKQIIGGTRSAQRKKTYSIEDVVSKDLVDMTVNVKREEGTTLDDVIKAIEKSNNTKIVLNGRELGRTVRQYA